MPTARTANLSRVRRHLHLALYPPDVAVRRLPLPSEYRLSLGSALVVYARNPFARLNGAYALLSLSLLAWVGTLFVFSNQPPGALLLVLGRANFAAVAIVAPDLLLFVDALRQEPQVYAWAIWIETIVLALLSIATGLVDQSEGVQAGVHITHYGVLFPLYFLHVVLFICLAIWRAFAPAAHLRAVALGQLRLVGIGILLSAAIGIVTNALVPYLFRDFRYIDVGTLATIFFIAAITYAISMQHLFNIQIAIRTTVIFGLLIAFGLELYQLAVELLATLLPLGDPGERHIAAASIALIINAFTHEPLKKLLDRLADRIVSHKPRTPRPTK